jgi:hypothetical protein
MVSRKTLLTILLGLVVLWGGWRIYSGWGLVSLDFTDAPVSKILSAISRQGGIEIATDLDPATPVTIQVHRVPPLEALDIVAVRTDSSWRLAFVGARTEPEIETALGAFRAKQQAGGWTTHGAGGFNAVQSRSGTPLDLSLVEWQPQGGGDLQTLLAQAADETGVILAAPSDWSSTIAAPEGGRISDAASALFRAAGGTSREVYLLRGPEPGEQAGEDGENWRGRRTWIGSAPRDDTREGNGRGRGFGGPESAAKRAEAQIKLLPAEEQKTAREDVSMMREFWQSVRELPEEQRRAKAQEFFSRPEVQERMEDRRLARYAKMTPKQRIERSQRYWERKAEAKYRGGGQ